MQRRREESEETSQELRLAREQLQNTVNFCASSYNYSPYFRIIRLYLVNKKVDSKAFLCLFSFFSFAMLLLIVNVIHCFQFSCTVLLCRLNLLDPLFCSLPSLRRPIYSASCLTLVLIPSIRSTQS